MAKLWHVRQAQCEQTKTLNKLHQKVEEFMAGENIKLDQELVIYDIQGSVAHAKMLKEIGILTKGELGEILKGLKTILGEYKKGGFKIELEDEDVHTAVENKLVKLVGEVGKKLHTGRSRNDQILVDLKLYIKDKLGEVEKEAGVLIGALEGMAKKYGYIAMPGYTHMQKAMPTSIALWAQGYVATLKDDLILVKSVLELADQNPLGSGAGYGVSLQLDKQLTTKLLGFGKVQSNPISCQHSRGKIELAVIQVLVQVMITLSKLAADLLLFTTSEFDFFEVQEGLTTGSSIMPNKKNLDVAELIKAKAQMMVGWMSGVAGVCAGLPSGYNADVSETKEPLIKGLKVTSQCLDMSQLLIKNLKPNEKKLKAAMTDELYATDEVYKLVKKGVSFRDAYKKIKKEIYEKE